MVLPVALWCFVIGLLFVVCLCCFGCVVMLLVSVDVCVVDMCCFHCVFTYVLFLCVLSVFRLLCFSYVCACVLFVVLLFCFV